MSDQYETADPEGGRLLWGRLAVTGLALALTFLLGRCSAPDGVPLAEFDQATQRAQDLQEQNTLLSAELAAADASGTGDQATGSATSTSSTDADAAGTTEAEAQAPQGDNPADASPRSDAAGQTYVVEPGDTLGGIAAAVYGDSTKFEAIADANGIGSAAELAVGRELQIPPDPG